jgi:outer membrane protein W
MKKIILIALSVLFGVACLHTYAAVNRDGAFILVPGVGYYRFAHKRNLDSGDVVPDISIGYGFSDHISGEIFLTHITADQKNKDAERVSGGAYTLNGLYHFKIATVWQPYVLVGIGVIHLTPHSASDTDDQATLSAGVGMSYFFNDKIGFRLDVRDFYVPAGGKHDILTNFGVSFLL